MAITRYTRGPSLSPWRELDALSSRLSRFLDDSSPTGGAEQSGGWFPAVNVEEGAEELILTAELPGMNSDDIEIELENNVLTIRGEKREERQEAGEDRRFHLWERRYGSFQRSFSLPRTVKAEEIGANFRDGILHVHMPKSEEARGRKIQVRSEG